MYTAKRRDDFENSEVGAEVIELLQLMLHDDAYNTEPSYSANTELYPNNLIPFVDKHIDYLCNHAETNPHLYVSNLRLMTRVVGSSPRRQSV